MPTPTAPSHRYPTRQLHYAQTLGAASDVATIHHIANAIIHPLTGASMEYRHLIKSPTHKETWTQYFANELGRLSQGVAQHEKGNDSIFFQSHAQIPIDRHKDVTYGRIVVDYRPQKTDPNCTCLTVGSNLIDFPSDVSNPTAYLTTAKLVTNSTISTPGARYICGDVKNFYLGTPMARYKNMRLPISIIPQEIIDQYKLMDLVHNGYVYVKIRRGMYRLPQAGILANKLLTARLSPHGYYQCRHISGP